MKHLGRFAQLYFIAGTLFFLNSCTKKEAEPEPQPTQQLAPASVVAELRAMGMDMIETGKPVQVEGIYEMKPSELTATNIPDDYEVGHVFNDPYRFQFLNQNESQQTISMKYKVGTETGESSEGFIAGAGSKFTVFAITHSSYQNATSKSLEIISGEWTSSGIKGLQQAFYVLEKSDPDTLLVDVGSIRVSKDKNGLSGKIANLRQPADEVLADNKETVGRKVRGKR